MGFKIGLERMLSKEIESKRWNERKRQTEREREKEPETINYSAAESIN